MEKDRRLSASARRSLGGGVAPAVVRLGSVSVWKVVEGGGWIAVSRAFLAWARMVVWSSWATLMCAAEGFWARRSAWVVARPESCRKVRRDCGKGLMRGEGSMTGKIAVRGVG